MSTIIIGGEIEIGFTTRDNMAFYKIINSYQEIHVLMEGFTDIKEK